MDAVRNFPGQASTFVLSLGEKTINYIPTVASDFVKTCIRKSGAFLTNPTTQRAITGTLVIGATLAATVATVKYVVLPVLKATWNATKTATLSSREWVRDAEFTPAWVASRVAPRATAAV